MTSTQEFRILAGEVYQVDIKATNHPWLEGDIIENKNLTHKYQVLKIEDNTSNGMQAMAVAPVGKDGKAVENGRRLDIIIPVNKSEKGSMS